MDIHDRNAIRPSCPCCPNLQFRTKMDLKRHRKQTHWMIYKCSKCPATLAKDSMWKHMRDVHDSQGRRRTLKNLRRTTANTTKNKEENIPDYLPTLWSDDEGQSFSEGEGDLSSEDDKDELRHEGKGKQPVQDDRLPFGCNLCLESFLTAETLIMHTNFTHRWKCGYCPILPAFSSVSLWREHRAMIHGLVD